MNEKSVELFQNFQSKNDAMYDWTGAQLMTLTQMMSIVNYKEYETLMSVPDTSSEKYLYNKYIIVILKMSFVTS